MNDITSKLNSPVAPQNAGLPSLLKKSGARLKTIAPQGIDANRFSAALMAEVRSNSKLMECDPLSVLGAFVKSTQLGLEPGSGLGHAYFVPFKGECQLIIGYRGMMELAFRSGKVKSIAARTIYEHDHFQYGFGIEDTLEHIPATGDRGAMTGVYAIAKLAGGGVHFEVLSMDDIEKAKRASKTSSFGPWKDHFEEMAKKTAIRRLFKYLPVGTELNRAVAIDETGERKAQDNRAEAEAVLDGDFYEVEGTKKPD